jgi:hypothetical protein
MPYFGKLSQRHSCVRVRFCQDGFMGMGHPEGGGTEEFLNEVALQMPTFLAFRRMEKRNRFG